MFECHVCGNQLAHEAMVSEVFTVDDRRVLVERIPARVCARCGEPQFSAETAERVRRLVHGDGAPTGTVTMDVFALS